MKNTTLLGLLSFLILSTASLPTLGQTPCVENTHFTKKVILHDGKPYQMITFTNTSAECSWTVPAGATNIEYLVVGGGGSGGTAGDNSGCGGGGAGGLGYGTFVGSSSALLVKVGAGAVAPNTNGNNSVQGTNGGNSSLKGSQTTNPSPNVLAIGGGGGGKHKIQGENGGSGGGGGGRVSTLGGTATSATGAQFNLGFSGGTARGNNDDGRAAGGGGGGAGGVGSNGALTSSTAGNGGIGFLTSITGESVYFAGGGGGGAWDEDGAEVAGTGGNGGGGNGSLNAQAQSGTDGLGGGGGGAGEFGKGGDGGDGTVIIRYNDNINLATSAVVGAGIASEGGGLFITQGLTVDANKTFVIDAGVKLVVEGNVVNNGTIVIKASTTDTLVYGQLKWTGMYTGSGTVQVEKKLHAGWNLLAHGIQSPTAAYFGSVANGSNANLANLYSWGGTVFSPVYTATAVTNNQGYLAYVGTDGVHTAAGIQTFSGSPINEYTPPALYDNTKIADASSVTMYSAAQTRTGWNLIPNPFTSDLRVGDLTRSNINAAYYLRTSKGGYRAVAPAGIDPDIVPPLSAYWVQATGASPSMQRGNSGKVTLPPLAAPTFAGTTVGTPYLHRSNAATSNWNKAFLQVSATVTGKGERYAVLERGFVYSSSDNTPTVEEITSFVEGVYDTVKAGSGVSQQAFSKYLSNLNAATTYYIRPYAKSPSGYAYGTIQDFTTPTAYTCGSTVTFDYDNSSTSNNVNDVVMTSQTTYLNNECWMMQNLGSPSVATIQVPQSNAPHPQSTHYFQWGRSADGHQRPNSGVSTSISSTTTANSSAFVRGAFWTTASHSNMWQGMFGVNNPCPTGWRIPTAAEWTASVASDPFSETNASNAWNNLKLVRGNYRTETNTYYNHTVPASLTNLTTYKAAYWSSTVSGTSISALVFTRNHGVTASTYSVNGQEYARMTIANSTDFNNSTFMGAFVRCIRADGMINGAID